MAKHAMTKQEISNRIGGYRSFINIVVNMGTYGVDVSHMKPDVDKARDRIAELISVKRDR